MQFTGFTIDEIFDMATRTVATQRRGIEGGGNSHIIRRNASRNGHVYRFIDPVIMTNRKPRQRVLFNAGRDANPFFHLYESLWMLAGKNDVKSLKWYNSKIDQFSDNGETFNAAYGYRWRHWYDENNPETGLDQIQILIEHFKHYPDSRRAVLQMWDPHQDLCKIDNQFGMQSKDTACNLCIVFEIQSIDGCLELNATAYNRSNDTIWGALGANHVQFSMLLEYMANCISLARQSPVSVGSLHQISSNMHAYDFNFFPEKYKPGVYDADGGFDYPTPSEHKLVTNSIDVFDSEVHGFTSLFSGPFTCSQWDEAKEAYSEPFLTKVAAPMFLAWSMYKSDLLLNACHMLKHVEAADWRRAGIEWLERRMQKRMEMKGGDS